MTAEREQPEAIKNLMDAIAHLEAQRAILGDAVVDAAIATLEGQLAALRPAPAPAPLRAERKPVTVLFADLAGFTAFTEQADPETVRRVVNASFDTLKETIDHYGGHIDKYIGDEIMVLFGAPVVHEDHAERALRTALAMRVALRRFVDQLAADPQLAHLPPELLALDLHIGVNTGLVVAGGIGAQDEQQYSVVGDAVNVAKRLTDTSAPGQILVGAATYQLAAPLFEFTPLPPVTIKGKQEPQPVYELGSLKVQPGPVRGLETLGLRAPLVGRDAEIARLQEALARLQVGTGGAIGISGEAGVGKSRLIIELRRQATVAWYMGRCLSYGEMLSYHLFLSLLRHLIGATPEDDAATLAAHLRAFLEDLVSDRVDQIYPYLADFLGLPLAAVDRERLDALAGESRQWQVGQAFAAILSELARRSPVVIVMEDLHWVDPTSAVLLEQLLPLTDQVPLLFLLAQRPYGGVAGEELLSRLRAAPACRYEEIQLAPLSSAQSRELIWYLLAIEELPAGVRDLILSRAEGNPLFLEEILRSLIGQSVLQREEERWHLAPGVTLEQIDIPPTLQGVILARLDRLAAETKMVLQMASVIGRIFWYRVLDYILAVEQRLDLLLETHLARLEQVELIFETRHHPDLEYIFKHVLIQDAAYQSLLREQRRRFHQQVATAIEAVFAASLEEQYGLLARHYEAAGEVQQAIHYLRLAGDHAYHAYALPEAEGYYRRALDLISSEDSEARRQLLFQLGLVSMAQGEFAQAGEHYALAFQLEQRGPNLVRHTYIQHPLRVLNNSPLTLEPGIPVDLSSATVIQALFAGLVEFDEGQNVVPHMAERWEVDDEGRRFRFHLRRDARWSDGVPLTASDFAFAWRYYLRPDSASASVQWLYALRGAEDYHQGRTADPNTVGVRALDDHTLEVELTDPLAYFLPLLTGIIFYPVPSHRWPPARPPQEDPAGLVSNGPFRLAEWREGEHIIVERNPYYCGATRGNVERVRFVLATASTDQPALFAADEVDMCYIGADKEQTEAFQRMVPPERWLQKPSLSTFYYGLMPHIPPLDDRRVRQALILALDRSRLPPFIVPQAASLARGGFVPPGIPGHSPELSPPYAPEQARALLREAGYADGSALPPLRWAVMDGAPRTPLVTEVLSQWEMGLGLAPIADQPWSLAHLVSQEGDDMPHIFSMLWIADYPDPHNFVAQGLQHLRFWPDNAYREMAAEAARTLDVRRRMALYHELDRRLVVEEALCIPLTYGRISAVVQPRVRHFPILSVAHSRLKDVVLTE